MTPEEAAATLMWAAGYDKRINTSSSEEAQIVRRIWGNALEEIPFEFAKAVIDAHYRKSDAPEVKVAHILTAWRNAQRVEASKERVEATSVREAAEVLASGAPAWFHTYRAQCDAARAAGLPYPPAPHEAKTARPDPRERRCVNHDICACAHTECWDGWLDQEKTVAIAHGHRYRGTVRCPICEDAVKMRGELSPSRHRRGRR